MHDKTTFMKITNSFCLLTYFSSNEVLFILQANMKNNGRTRTANTLYRRQQKVEVPFPDGHGAHLKIVPIRIFRVNE